MIYKILRNIIKYSLMILIFNTQAQAQDDVLVIGQIMYDIIIQDAKKHDEIVKKFNIKKGGLKFLNSTLSNELDQIENTIKIPGGSANNTAVGLASFGNKVSFIGISGKDNLGLSYKNSLQDCHVNDLTIQCDSGNTGVVRIFISDDGERTMLASPGISKDIKYNNISKDLLKNYKLMFSEGYLWENDKYKDFINLYQNAKSSNCVTAFALSDKNLAKKFSKQWISLLKHVDIIFGDQEQIQNLFNVTNFTQVKPLLKNFNTIFVITNNKEGATIIDRQQEIIIPPYQIDKVIDATGAGDLFATGFIQGYIHNLPLRECGMLGAKTASLIIQQVGAKPRTSLKKLIQYPEISTKN